MDNSKLKDNDIGRNIRKKTHNLTQSRTPIDPLIARSRAFHSVISKTKFDIQEPISPYSFLGRNLNFKHFLDVKMSLEEEKIKRFKD